MLFDTLATSARNGSLGAILAKPDKRRLESALIRENYARGSDPLTRRRISLVYKLVGSPSSSYPENWPIELDVASLSSLWTRVQLLPGSMTFPSRAVEYIRDCIYTFPRGIRRQSKRDKLFSFSVHALSFFFYSHKFAWLRLPLVARNQTALPPCPPLWSFHLLVTKGDTEGEGEKERGTVRRE